MTSLKPYLQRALRYVGAPTRTCNTTEFSLRVNVFFEINDKCLCQNVILTCNLLCKRPRPYQESSKTQVRKRIFKLTPIHVSVIYQYLLIRQISLPSKETAMKVPNTTVQNIQSSVHLKRKDCIY